MGFYHLDRGGDSMAHLGGTGTSVADATVMPIVLAMLSDGRDGEADLDGTNEVPFATRAGSVYTLIRVALPSYYRTRVGVEVKSGGYPILCSGDVLNEGSTHADGNNASGQTAGAALAAGYFAASVAGAAGGAIGANGSNGTGANLESPSGRYGSAPGGAGAATTGGVEGAKASTSATRGTSHAGPAGMAIGTYLSTLGVTSLPSGGPGGAGGGGGGAVVGGGGGGSAGVLELWGRTITNTGRLSANGGDGAAGAGAGAGGGSGGSGGAVRLRYGTYTGNVAQTYGGRGGAAGDSTAKCGHCGNEGEVIVLNPILAYPKRYTLTAGECAAVLVGGVAIQSGSFIAGSDCGSSTGVAATGSGGGGLSIWEGTTTDGEMSLRFNALSSAFRLDLRVRGTVVLSTDDVNATAVAGPTFIPWIRGDRIDWMFWYDPAGGARSMGIRWAVNHCCGNDKTGTGSGAALAAVTAASMQSQSTTAASSAASYITSNARSANMIPKIVICGDSITASRRNSIGWDGVAAGTRLGLDESHGPALSLALQGSTWASQTTAWQASNARGNAAVLAVVTVLGHNDVSALTAAAAISVLAQAFMDDVATNNPLAKRVLCRLTPSASGRTLAQDTIWAAVDLNYAGTGLNNVTGVDARVSSHQTTMGDNNGSLRRRAETNDYTHPNFFGRKDLATAMATSLTSLGITLSS